MGNGHSAGRRHTPKSEVLMGMFGSRGGIHAIIAAIQENERAAGAKERGEKSPSDTEDSLQKPHPDATSRCRIIDLRIPQE